MSDFSSKITHQGSGSTKYADGLQFALSQLVTMVGAAISNAHDVGHVTQALYSLASLLHTDPGKPPPGDSPFNKELNQLASACRDQARIIFPNEDPKEAVIRAFYGGLSFPAVAKILLFRVAADWLTCFSLPEQMFLFDGFFTCAPPSEALMALVPALTPTKTAVEEDLAIESSSVCAVAERLLVLCLIEKHGLRTMALEGGSFIKQDVLAVVTSSSWTAIPQSISRLAQLIASIPDKARINAPPSMHSPLFYQSATSQLLAAAEEHWKMVSGTTDNTKASSVDTIFSLIGEVFARFCRRGHADVVVSQMLPGLLQHVKDTTCSGKDEKQLSDGVPRIPFDVIESHLKSSFWPMITASMKDLHAIERWAEALLLQMADTHVKDWDAYCILWALFANLISSQAAIRALFTERFLLWKVLPICCLRWILHFAVLCCPPEQRGAGLSSWKKESRLQKDVIMHLVEVWAEVFFIQSAQMQQQAYLTAAVGLSLKVMTKEDLESSGNLLQSLLQGISRRLESPLVLVRTMAKRVALAFSLVINPANPLLLDEDDTIENLCDWEELGSDRPGGMKERAKVDTLSLELGHDDGILENDTDAQLGCEQYTHKDSESKQEARRRKQEKKERLASEAYDPDEVVDLGTYASGGDSDEDTNTDAESESSLQPYDMSDDESDLDRSKFPMQLSDCAAGLRKGDEPDLVERALEVSERLVRATPDELENAAPDLAHALIHVRCSAVAIEGQEQSSEDKRHSALVALLVCAPQTVRVLIEELYSAHVDVSQRLLILDVMSYAARELANSSSLGGSTYEHERQLIGEIPGAKWYGPGSNCGPIGAGPWKEVHEPDAMVKWIHKYERELPQKPNVRALGKSRRWGHRSMLLREEQRKQLKSVDGIARNNQFVPFAATFMLPVMRDYDKKRHGVDFLGRDFIVLGRLICMLGVCMECVSLHPDAPILAAALLNLISSRQISSHPEAYVRRSALYAASRVLVALHPSHVVSALNAGDLEIGRGLDWIREWALQVAGDDSDSDCSSMAMACVHLHSELVLQASRSVQSEHATTNTAGNLAYKPMASVIIPFK